MTIIMSSESNKLLRHTILFSSFVFLAQVVGLVRDLYLARIFGVGQILDVYYMAFKVPDFLNVFYSVFLGSVVFIPLLTASRASGGDGEVSKKVREIGSLVLFLVIGISALLFIFMPQIAEILVPSWNEEKISLLILLSRILLFAQFFFPVGILAGSLGMVYEKPFYMAVSGFVYNLFIFLGILVLAPSLGIVGVSVSVTLGAICFALIQIWPKEVRKIFANYRLEWDFQIWINFFKQNFYRFLAVVAYQLFAVLLLYIAAYAGEGGVSVFSISYNIFMALFFILGASLSTAAMPNIARLHVEKNQELQKENLNNSIVYMFFVGVFISLFAFIFSKEIIQILYFFSHISIEKELQIASIFALLVLALPFFNLLEVIRKYLYSTNQIPFAGIMTVTLLVAVLAFSLFFTKYLGLEILPALTYAIICSNIFSLFSAILFLEFKKQIDLQTIAKNSYKVLFIAFFSFISYHGLVNFLDLNFSNYFLNIFVHGSILLLTFVVYVYIFADQIGKSILYQIAHLFDKQKF